MSHYSIAIHGGAGTLLRGDMTPEKEMLYLEGLRHALDSGYRLLEQGASAIEAVTAAVISLEDNILFNAGRGSVFASDGSQEMDASIMDGHTGLAGAVSAVRRIKNPVLLAKAVMTETEHVYLSGQGAMDFAKDIGLPLEDDAYFFSEFRHQQWKALQGTDISALDHNVNVDDKKFGTVGAVACDRSGHTAAATSTGGMTNKRWGRVGDSPIIGAGTYANDNTCAISCTGHGEMFIRSVAAYDVSCLVEYKGFSLEEAMRIVVNEKLVRINGEGGMIGVDARGNTALLFNSDGMYRGARSSSGTDFVAIYGD